jgi:penicillin-binding protein 2
MKRQAVVFLLALLISLPLSACDVISSFGGSEPAPTLGPDTQAPESEPTAADLGEPDGVARSFLDAWMDGNYEAMYAYLSPNSQAEYRLEEFVDTYTSTADTMRLINLDATPLSVLVATTGNTAQAQFRVVYHTRSVGDIEKEMPMQLVLADEVWGIVWTPALILPELAGGNTLQLEVENPARANIYDRNGQWLVSSNASTVTLTIVPGEVGEGYEDDMLNLLSQVLRMPIEQIRQQYAGAPDDWVVPLGDVDAEVVQQNWEALRSYPPLGTMEKSGRRYYNVLASHVLGYAGFIQEDQLEEYQARGYRGDEIVGQSGLEAWGEEYLSGTPGGTLTAWTADGQYYGEIAHRDPEPAQSLYTTLDRNLQIIVQDAIEEAYRVGADTWAPTAGGTAVVVLDVRTGNVLAMASYPYFDPNVMYPNNNHPLAQTSNYFQEIVNSPLRPLLNRATQGQYPPGSIFKIVSAATALESGIFTADSTYTCTGVWNELGDFVRYDWLEGGHGTLTLRQGLTASCNPWFYHIGLETGQADYSLLAQYAREFGMGSELGIDIAEEPGLIPDPDWLWQQRGEEWTLNDNVNMAIGQGAVLVTPLQIATMVSAVANGGTVYRPQLVDRIGLIGEDPTIVTEPEVLHEVAVSDENLQTIREGMRGVATDIQIGTAEYRLGSMQIAVAGKTGTAQVSGAGYPLAWFGGFVPYDEPELAIAIMVENGGQGSSVAAPIFRRIVEKYYNLPVLDYPPDWGDPDTFDFVTDDTVGE